MTNFNTLARSAAVAAMLLTGTIAHAEGKADRARQAIATARAKVEIANKLGVAGDVPRLQAEAQAMLRTAEEDLASGHKVEAIADANRAGQLADTAIGVAEKNHRVDANVNAAVAVDAQQQAGVANARADVAEQAAASAAADAAAARAVPAPAPVVIAAPAPTTTVTTETVKTAIVPAKRVSVRRPVRRIVHKTRHSAPRAAVTERTTTTVSTHN